MSKTPNKPEAKSNPFIPQFKSKYLSPCRRIGLPLPKRLKPQASVDSLNTSSDLSIGKSDSKPLAPPLRLGLSKPKTKTSETGDDSLSSTPGSDVKKLEKIVKKSDENDTKTTKDKRTVCKRLIELQEAEKSPVKDKKKCFGSELNEKAKEDSDSDEISLKEQLNKKAEAKSGTNSKEKKGKVRKDKLKKVLEEKKEDSNSDEEIPLKQIQQEQQTNKKNTEAKPEINVKGKKAKSGKNKVKNVDEEKIVKIIKDDKKLCVSKDSVATKESKRITNNPKCEDIETLEQDTVEKGSKQRKRKQNMIIESDDEEDYPKLNVIKELCNNSEKDNVYNAENLPPVDLKLPVDNINQQKELASDEDLTITKQKVMKTYSKKTTELKIKDITNQKNEKQSSSKKVIKVKRSLSLKTSGSYDEDKDDNLYFKGFEPDLEKHGEITEELLKDLQKQLKEKQKLLADLNQANIYKEKHNVEELNQQTLTWKTGCIAALNDLLPQMRSYTEEMDMKILLKNMHIPPGKITLNEDGDLV